MASLLSFSDVDMFRTDITLDELVTTLADVAKTTTESIEHLLEIVATWLQQGPDHPVWRNCYYAAVQYRNPWHPELSRFSSHGISALQHIINFLMLPQWLNTKYVYPELFQRYMSAPNKSDWHTLVSSDEEDPLFEAAIKPILSELKAGLPYNTLSTTEYNTIQYDTTLSMDTVWDLSRSNRVLKQVLDLQERYNDTNIMLTLRGGHVSNITQVTISPYTPATLFAYACMSGSRDLIQHLEQWISMEKPDVIHTNLLHAISSGSMDLIQYISQKFPPRSNMSHLISTAINSNRKDIIEYLLGWGVRSSRDNAVTAARQGDLELLDYMVQKGAPLTDEVYRVAIQGNHIHIVEYAIDHKCPIHICLPHLCWAERHKRNNRNDILRLLYSRTNIRTLVAQTHPGWTDEVFAFIEETTADLPDTSTDI